MREGKRQALLLESESVRAAILAKAREVRRQDWDTAFLARWSVEDLLAHLQGWDWINLGAFREVLIGQLPTFYVLYDREWTTLNRHLVAECKDGGLPGLVQAARESHARLMAAARSLEAGDLDRDFGVRARGVRVTIERLLRWVLADEKTHLAQLQEFVSVR